ncbi:phosphatase PAP2 family protein [Pseudactinotalea sp.]|uniref:phosphatase PAP2 family protein n=1 Tax=Pseudactinotalea sp. TaxID=1926260 RepID=UPI003B3B6DBB
MNEGDVAVQRPSGGAASPGTRALAPGVLAPAIAAVVSLLLVVVTWRLFVVTPRGQMVEEAARIGSRETRDSLSDVTGLLLDAVTVPSVVIVVIAAVLIALVQKRWSIAIAAIVVLVGANLTTQVLKEVLERPVEDASPIVLNSFPSGHATVAASVAATALLVLPIRWRPPAAVLGAFLAAVLGISTMIGNEVAAWHRASDVVAAMLIAALWYFLAETVLAAIAQRHGESGSGGNPPRALVKIPLRILTVLGTICLGLGGGALAATAVRAPITTDLGYQVAFLGSVLGVAAVAFFTLAMMLRLRPHHPRPQADPL